MHILTRRPEAEQDIDIYLHVSRDNPTAAEKLVRAINAKCDRLARSPMIGRARPELRPDLRSFPLGPIWSSTAPSTMVAEIVRVIRAARNLDDLI